MDVVYDLLVYAHVLGLAALIGGYFAVAARRSGAAFVPSAVMVWGVRAQLITGLAMVGLAEAVLDYELNQVKIGVKLLLALVAAYLVEKGAAKARRGESAAPGMVHAAGAVAMLNAAVAVLWS